jgi:uncharacterized Zn-finger protein
MAEQSAEPGASGGAKKYTVSRKDLPLSCPTPEMELWNMHPRVYLPIEQSGHAVCPYCGAEFELKD